MKDTFGYNFRKIAATIREEIEERNVAFCPEENIRLNIFVDEHFVQRLVERFNVKEFQPILSYFYKWLDENYCELLFYANIENYGIKEYKIDSGTYTIVIRLFDKRIRLLTVFKN